MCFSDFVCEQRRKSLDPVVFTRTFSSIYISSLPLNSCSMETMCCVLLGKAEAKGNGCGQTIVLEREQERNIRRRQRGRKEKMEK